MFGTHLSRMGSVHRFGLVQRTIGILRKYGTNAHVYLPGVGTISGITAGNYLDSAGTTAASVDNPVGLSLDALQAMTLGSELVTNGTNLVSTTGWTATALSGAPASLSVSGGSLVVTNTGTTYGVAAQTVPVTSGLTYQVTALLTKGTAYAVNIRVGSTALGVEYTDQGTTGIAVPITVTFIATSSNVFISLLNTNTEDGTGSYGKISVREIPGIHARQATTANKPILRQSAGKYSWQFDGVNDRLSLSAPLFQMSDDHCVIAGFSTTTTASGTIAAPSTTAGVSNGRVCRLAIDSGNVYAYWSDSVGISSQLNSSAINVNTPYVAAARKVSNARILRMNGIQAATDSTVLGSTTSNTGTIGAINVVSVADYFSGSIYPVIAIKGTVTDSDLLVLERFVGQLSGVSL